MNLNHRYLLSLRKAFRRRLRKALRRNHRPRITSSNPSTLGLPANTSIGTVQSLVHRGYGPLEQFCPIWQSSVGISLTSKTVGSPCALQVPLQHLVEFAGLLPFPQDLYLRVSLATLVDRRLHRRPYGITSGESSRWSRFVWSFSSRNNPKCNMHSSTGWRPIWYTNIHEELGRCISIQGFTNLPEVDEAN
jgi:hypothetical protein